MKCILNGFYKKSYKNEFFENYFFFKSIQIGPKTTKLRKYSQLRLEYDFEGLTTNLTEGSRILPKAKLKGQNVTFENLETQMQPNPKLRN